MRISRKVVVIVIAVLVLTGPVLAISVSDSVSRPDDNDSATNIDEGGVKIKLDTAAESITAELSSNVGNAQTAYLRDQSGSLIDSKSVSGSTVTFDTKVRSGTYIVSVDADTHGYYTQASFPYESSSVSITGGWRSGDNDNPFPWNIRTVSYQVDTTAPSVDEMSASAVDDGSQATLSIDISDPDFAEWSDEDVEVRFYNAGNDQLIGSETLTANGTASQIWDYSREGPKNWYVIAEDSFGDTTKTSVFYFGDREPTVSNPDPAGGEGVSGDPVKLNITVGDADFGTDVGDEVTVTFIDESDDSVMGTQTVTQNQTVTETFKDPVAGTNTWSVTVEDNFSNTVQSSSYTFETPKELELRNESAPGQLVTAQSDIEVRFFAQESGDVITRTTSDGTVNMTGLPVDEPLIASTDADGYFQRSIAIDSIIEQQRMFLLPESADASQVDWVLDDNTGRFDPTETVLYVERPIEINGTTKYRTIYGETFGGTGRTASTLATDDRYRLRVDNQQGNVRLLGSYVAAGAAEEELTVGSVDFPGLDDTGTAFSAQLDDDADVIEYRFADDAAETSELTVEIYRNGSLIENATLNGPVQTAREQITLSSLNHSEGDSYRIEYSAERNGIVVSGSRIVGDVPELSDDWNIDSGLLNILGFVTVIAAFGGVVILSPRHAGIVATSLLFGLSIIGVVTVSNILVGFAFVTSGIFAAAGGDP